MAYEIGKDWRVYVGDGAGTEVFSALGGEGSFEMQRASDDIDLTTKDDATYKNGTYGLQQITFSVSGKVKLPDTALTRIDTVAKSGTPEVNIQIKKGSTIKFLGRVAVGNFSTSFPSDGPATYSFSARNVGAPTTDNLGA